MLVELNDNISASSTDRQADIIVSPQMSLVGTWPITRYNTLTMQLGFGYVAYLEHPELDTPSNSFIVDPGLTKLAVDVKVGDVILNFHDRPALQQDPTNELTLRNPTASFTYSRLTNVIGVSAIWDLNRIVVSGGYDHMNVFPFQSEF